MPAVVASGLAEARSGQERSGAAGQVRKFRKCEKIRVLGFRVGSKSWIVMIYCLRTGVLGDQVKVTKDKTKVTITSESEMSKRCARRVLPARHPGHEPVGVMQAWVCVCW